MLIKSRNRLVAVIAGPSKIDGAISRGVKLADGSGRVETWGGPDRGWMPGGAGWDEFFFAPPASPAAMREAGIREADIRQSWPRGFPEPPSLWARWRSRVRRVRRRLLPSGWIAENPVRAANHDEGARRRQ